MTRTENDKIVTVERGHHTTRGKYSDVTETRVGEYIAMENGDTWFHPYSGGAPTKVAKA